MAYLGDSGDTFAYNNYVKYGRQSLAQQQAAALNAAGRATGGELVGLPGYAAGSVGPGYLMRLRRDALRRGARQIGSNFSELGAQQAGREQDLLSSLIQRRQQARIAAEEAKRNRPSTGQQIGQALGTAASLFIP